MDELRTNPNPAPAGATRADRGDVAAGAPAPRCETDIVGFAHGESSPMRAETDASAADAALAYWRRALSGAPARLDLPTRQPRPAQACIDGAMLPLRIDAALADALRRRADRDGSGLFALVLAAWALVLSRLSGQDDIVVGASDAQREPAGGPPPDEVCADALALRIDLSGDPEAAN